MPRGVRRSSWRPPLLLQFSRSRAQAQTAGRVGREAVRGHFEACGSAPFSDEGRSETALILNVLRSPLSEYARGHGQHAGKSASSCREK
jgi:hypothetical protein